MALTEISQLLIDGLQLCALEEWQRAVIYIEMDTEEKKMEMAQFIGEHEKATAGELMGEARRIAEK